MKTKDVVTFRFKSWALCTSETDYWSPWNHCTRATMMEFLRVLPQLDEASSVRLSPDYKKKYSALMEVQVIVDDIDCWTWKQLGGWQRTPDDPRFANVPTGKGKRPAKKSREQLAADRAAADDEIFGTADDLDEVTTVK